MRERQTDTEREDPLPSTEPVFDCSSPPGRSIACRSTGKTVQPDGLDSSSDPRLHTVRLWASYINSRHLGFLRPLHPHRQNNGTLWDFSKIKNSKSLGRTRLLPGREHRDHMLPLFPGAGRLALGFPQ